MPAIYDILHSFQDIHNVVIKFAEDLNDEQIRWRPEGYSTSIGFHLWHLARESDFLKAAILTHFPLDQEFGEPVEIWARDGLAEKWGFPLELHATVGTGLSDEAAASLPIPAKCELIDYLGKAYTDIESFIEMLDNYYPTFEEMDEEFRVKIERIRYNLIVFLQHDCRHLGMMECLKGLQTGFGSATEERQ